jgi:hypothetical protein
MINGNYALTLILLSASTIGLAAAQNNASPNPRQFGFPPIGLGSTETAEVNVVNTAANSSAGAAASCTGSISFYNLSGALIGTATPFTVTAGQIASARLAFASSGGSGTRTSVRAVVSVTPSTASPRPPCALGVSLETLDTATGATHAIVTNPSSPYRD